MVPEPDEPLSKLECPLIDLISLLRQDSVQATAQSELRCAQHASSQLEPWWNSAPEHAKAHDSHLAHFTQQPPGAQTKQAHKKSSSRGLEAALLGTRDAVEDQSSLALNAGQFIDGWWEKSTDDYFMPLPGHVRTEGLLFCSNTSKQYGFIETTAHGRHEDIRRVITEGLDRARSLLEFGTNGNSEVGGSSVTRGDGGNTTGGGVSLVKAMLSVN